MSVPKQTSFQTALILLSVMLLGTALPCMAGQKVADIGLETNGDAWQFYTETPRRHALPRIVLIGDSIVNGYRGTVCEALAGVASVDTWLTPLNLKSEALHDDLARVLAQGPYAVIHFNIGLHGWSPGRIPEGEYEPLLRAYVNILKEQGGKAKLIWGSTTQITVRDHPEALDPEHNPTIVKRNAIAACVMKDMGVTVNDLYGLMSDKLNLARGDKFHWQEKACMIQGKQVADFVKKALEGDTSETGG